MNIFEFQEILEDYYKRIKNNKKAVIIGAIVLIAIISLIF